MILVSTTSDEKWAEPSIYNGATLAKPVSDPNENYADEWAA